MCAVANKVLLLLWAVRRHPPKMGLKNREMTKKPQMVRPVTPVRPPSRMPEADSMYAVAEEEPNTPVQEPTLVNRRCWSNGGKPLLSLRQSTSLGHCPVLLILRQNLQAEART